MKCELFKKKSNYFVACRYYFVSSRYFNKVKRKQYFDRPLP